MQKSEFPKWGNNGVDLQKIERSTKCMSKHLTPGQKVFWRTIQATAQLVWKADGADPEAAADALALDQEIESRFMADSESRLMVAEPKRKTKGAKHGR